MKLSVIQGIYHNSGRRDEHRMRVSLNAKELKTMTKCNSAQEAKDEGWRATLLGDSFGFQHVGMVKSDNLKDGSFCLDIDYVRVRSKSLTIPHRVWKHRPGCNIFIPISKVGLGARKHSPVNRYPEAYPEVYKGGGTAKKSFKLEIPTEWFKKTTKPPAAAGVFASTNKTKTTPILSVIAKTPISSMPNITTALATAANAHLAKQVRALNKATATWAKANANNPNNLLRMTIQNGQLVVSVTMTTKII